MATFFMFGQYSRDSIRSISAKRTEKADSIIKGYGGTLRSVYALLGEHDLVIIAELPGIQEALQVSVELTKDSGISFASVPALPVADFDRMFEK